MKEITRSSPAGLRAPPGDRQSLCAKTALIRAFCVVSDVFSLEFHEKYRISNTKIHRSRSTVAWDSRKTRRDHSEYVGVSDYRIPLLDNPWIGILTVLRLLTILGFRVWLTFVSPPLMGNPRWAANNCWKTCQYSRPATLAPKISTRVEVHASHPDPPTSPILLALHPENSTWLRRATLGKSARGRDKTAPLPLEMGPEEAEFWFPGVRLTVSSFHEENLSEILRCCR